MVHATVKNWKHFDKRILRFILNDYTFHYTTLLNKVEINSLYDNKRINIFFNTSLQESIF